MFVFGCVCDKILFENLYKLVEKPEKSVWVWKTSFPFQTAKFEDVLTNLKQFSVKTWLDFEIWTKSATGG